MVAPPPLAPFGMLFSEASATLLGTGRREREREREGGERENICIQREMRA